MSTLLVWRDYRLSRVDDSDFGLDVFSFVAGCCVGGAASDFGFGFGTFRTNDDLSSVRRQNYETDPRGVVISGHPSPTPTNDRDSI